MSAFFLSMSSRQKKKKKLMVDTVTLSQCRYCSERGNWAMRIHWNFVQNTCKQIYAYDCKM